MNKDPYKILGVAETADEATIKSAYKNLSKEYHPDMNEGKSVEEKAKAEEKFKEISIAYAILSDKEKRRKYDLSRKEPSSSTNVTWDTIFKNFFVNNWNDFFGNQYSTKTYKKKEQIDFSEIIELEKQIARYEEIKANLHEKEEIYEDEIDNQRNYIKTKIEKLRTEKTSEEGYLNALKYIEKFRRRDSNRIISLTITKKQLDLYENCVRLVEQVEKQLTNFKEALEKEIIEPLEKKLQKTEEEYWDIHRKVSALNSQYYNHRLRYDYERFKREQESHNRTI